MTETKKLTVKESIIQLIGALIVLAIIVGAVVLYYMLFYAGYIM